jgi:hypothetical protein
LNMFYSKGDIVTLVTDEKAEILDEWGVARQWYKVRTTDNRVLYIMQKDIDSLHKRFKPTKGRK